MRRHANPSMQSSLACMIAAMTWKYRDAFVLLVQAEPKSTTSFFRCCNARHFHFVIIMLAALLLNHLQQQCSCCHASPFSDCNNLTIFLANYASILSIIWLVLTMSLYFSTLFLGVRWRENEGIIWPECDEVALSRKQEIAVKVVDRDLITVDAASDAVIDFVCCICLCGYQLPEDSRKIVQGKCCGNIYHRNCITLWLMQNRDDCPMCRAKIVTTKRSSKLFSTTID